MKPGEIEVSVLNGTAVAGLAASFGDKVERQGFKLGAVTNSSSSLPKAWSCSGVATAGGAPRGRALEIPRVRPMTRKIAAVSAGARSRSSSARTMPRRRVRSPSRLRAARPRHARGLRLAQRLKRDPLVLDHVTFGTPASRAFTPNHDCRFDRIRIRFRVTRSDRADVQVVKPGGKLIVTLARDVYLRRYRFFTFYWDGRSRRPAGRPRAATSCGSSCSGRTAPWSPAASCACTAHRAGRPGTAAG